MFGHSAMMFQHGCYIDGDPVNGVGGDPADPNGNPNDIGDQQDDPEGEPDPEGAADDPDQQKRTSKQDPKVDAAYAEARRAKQETEALRAQLADYHELEKEYEEFGLKGPKAIAEAVKAEKRRVSQTNATEEASFSSWVKGEVSRLRAAGYDELAIEAYVDGKEAKYEAYKLKRDSIQEKEQRKRERELEKQEREQEKQGKAIEKTKQMVLDEFKELRKEYPDLLPAGVKNFDDLVEKCDKKVIDKMFNERLTFESAFKLVNLKKIAKREAEKDDEKEKSNAERSTSSGREKGDASGGTYGLTPRQQGLAKEGGMSNKEYASLIKHVKK